MFLLSVLLVCGSQRGNYYALKWQSLINVADSLIATCNFWNLHYILFKALPKPTIKLFQGNPKNLWFNEPKTKSLIIWHEEVGTLFNDDDIPVLALRLCPCMKGCTSGTPSLYHMEALLSLQHSTVEAKWCCCSRHTAPIPSLPCSPEWGFWGSGCGWVAALYRAMCCCTLELGWSLGVLGRVGVTNPGGSIYIRS